MQWMLERLKPCLSPLAPSPAHRHINFTSFASSRAMDEKEPDEMECKLDQISISSVPFGEMPSFHPRKHCLIRSDGKAMR